MMTTVQAQLPPELVSEARAFIDQGWAGNFDDLLAEALRRFLESHSSAVTESFVREDVAWGLHGSG